MVHRTLRPDHRDRAQRVFTARPGARLPDGGRHCRVHAQPAPRSEPATATGAGGILASALRAPRRIVSIFVRSGLHPNSEMRLTQTPSFRSGRASGLMVAADSLETDTWRAAT